MASTPSGDKDLPPTPPAPSPSELGPSSGPSGDRHIDTAPLKPEEHRNLTLARAGTLFTEIARIKERTLGPLHPETLDALLSIAHNLYYQRSYREAVGVYRTLLERKRERFGPEHPKTLVGMDDLGWACWLAAQEEEAARWFAKALEIRERLPEVDGFLMTRNREQLAKALGNLGRWREQAEVCRKDAEAKRKAWGAEHPDTVKALNDLAMAVQGEGRQYHGEWWYK